LSNVYLNDGERYFGAKWKQVSYLIIPVAWL